MKFTLILAAVFIIQLGCASSEFKGGREAALEIAADTLRGDAGAEISSAQDTSGLVYDFERETSKSETDTVTAVEVETLEPIDTEATAVEEIERPGSGYDVGYRIQIFATRELEKAEAVQKEAVAKTGLSAYIEYEDGLYKVRVGDFPTKGEAEKVRTIVGKSYPDCWIVQTTIRR